MRIFLILCLCFCSPIWASKVPHLSHSISGQVTQAYRLYEQEKFAETLQVLKRCEAKTAYDRAFISRFIGNLYWALNKPKKSLLALEKAVNEKVLTEKEQQETLRMLADLYLNEQQTDKAIKVYLSLLAEQKDIDIYQNLALAFYQKQSWQDVVSYTDKAIKLSQDFNKRAKLLQLSACYELKQYKKASWILFELTQYFPQEKRWWMQLAGIYRLIDKPQKALATYELAYLKGFLTSRSEVRNLAKLRAAQGSPYKAAQLLENLNLLDSLPDEKSDKDIDNLSLLIETATFWQQAKNAKRSEVYWRKIASLSGKAEHLLIQAQLLYQLGKYEEMLLLLNKIKSADTHLSGRLALMKTQVLFELGRYSEAATSAQGALNYPKYEKPARSWLTAIERQKAYL